MTSVSISQRYTMGYETAARAAKLIRFEHETSDARARIVRLIELVEPSRAQYPDHVAGSVDALRNELHSIDGRGI